MIKNDTFIRILSIALVLVLIVSLSLNIVSWMKNKKIDQKSKSVMNIINQFEVARSAVFIATVINEQDNINNKDLVEVFDVNVGEVTKTFEVTEEIKKEALENINNITGLYVKVDALPKDGLIFKIPFEPPLNVENNWILECNINYIEEAFIIVPDSEPSYILILDQEYKPCFFNYNGKNEIILSYIYSL